MKIHTQAIAYIAASPETVYSTLTTPHNFPSYFRGFGPVPGVSHEALPDGKIRYEVGILRKMYNEDTSVLTEKITELEYPNLFAYEIVSGIPVPFSLLVNHGRSVWNCLPHNHGTLLEWHYIVTLTSVAAYPLAFPLVRFFMRKSMQHCLLTIKINMEKSIPATA